MVSQSHVDGVCARPFWWEEAPRPQSTPTDLPARADLVIVGSGYTGLSAALTAARAGRDVLVLDSQSAGHGCSTRNGGQVGADSKLVVDRFNANRDDTKAKLAHQERRAAVDYLRELIRAEGIDCQFQQVGRFIGAHRPEHYDMMARNLEQTKDASGVEGDVVSRANQHSEIGSDRYFGGVVLHRDVTLHPGLLHQGMLERAIDSGARVVDNTTVVGVDEAGSGFSVKTSRGCVAARDVLIATNGYTTNATPDLKRRVIPVGSYMIATEPIDTDVMARLTPNRRAMSDTRKVVFYFRPSFDGRRFLFGGRVASGEIDVQVSGKRLHRVLAGIFPDLADVGVSHSWMGFVAYTFDHMPHLGQRNGIHYAMGYCGGGVHLATYLGHRVAQKIIGTGESMSAFDAHAFPTRPYYTGNPWFLPLAVARYQIADRWGV